MIIEHNQMEQVKIGHKMIDVTAPVYHDGQVKTMSLSDYKGKWYVLFFYPADFTFVCPTELEELAVMYDSFQKIDCEIISVSTDTAYAHKAWQDVSPAIKKVKYPMLSDASHTLSTFCNVLIEGEGLALRGTFVVDPDGIVRGMEVNDNSIGRSAKELLRKVKAAQFVREHGDQVCPASWEEGDDTLTPGTELVGKL
jgi:peroxiredoxin (alkyl hydroperoxide reductase subunit C)